MTVSSEIILLGDGMVFAHESSKSIEPSDFYGEVRVSCWISARSEAHLQLPLKLNIVGKELREVQYIVLLVVVME